MRHIIYTDDIKATYKIAILIKDLSFDKDSIYNYYIEPLVKKGINIEDIIVFSLTYNQANKAPIKLIKEVLNNLAKGIAKLKIQYLLITDGNYFKAICGTKKSDPYYGHALMGYYAGFEKITCILSLSYAALFYNPALRPKLTNSILTMYDVCKGILLEPGHDVYHSEYYPETPKQVEEALESLHQYPSLAIDIEGFSLRFNKAKIATISFAWDAHNGIAFDISHTARKTKSLYPLLKKFFINYKGRTIWHNCGYDIQVIIFELFMNGYLDMKGMLQGLDVMFRNIDDTKIITYLATNTTAGNKLDLKSNTQEYMGNYAMDDINDITLIKIADLLKYNLGDALATNYLQEKYYPILVEDNQEQVYKELFLPSLKNICQMQLTGMPLDMYRVKQVKRILQELSNKDYGEIMGSSLIQAFELNERIRLMTEKNATLKKKVKPIEDWDDHHFNPSSGPQIARLLHKDLGLDIIETTDTGLPATGAKVLEKHINLLISEHGITEEELNE